MYISLIIAIVIISLIMIPFVWKEIKDKSSDNFIYWEAPDLGIPSRGTTPYLRGIEGLEPYNWKSRPLIYRIDK